MGRPVLLRTLATLGCVAALSVALACSHAPPAEPPGAEGEPETARAASPEPAEPLPDGGEDEAHAGAPEAEGQAPEGEDRGERARELDDDEILIERGTSVERDETVILIERGGGTAPPSLYEAAEKAREKRARTGASRVSVTDENLHEFQGEGLTYAEPEDGAAEEEAGDEAPEEAAGAEEEVGGTEAETEAERAGGEEYWRSRLLDLRLRLREAVDELGELQDRAGSLRRSFYAQDDPYVRDGRIKPAWDRVLDRIESTRRRIGELRDELDGALEEGRRAGALPGWLREGVELEPAPEELPEEEPSGAHEARDPQMADEPRDPQRMEEEREPPP